MKKGFFWCCMMGAGFLFWVMVIIQIVRAGGDSTIIKPDPEIAPAGDVQQYAPAETGAVSVSLETDTIIEDSAHEDTVDNSKAGTRAGCVNVNTAKSEDLLTLQGIGPVLAQRIIEFRTANGKFINASDLVKVKGIGEGKLKKIRDRICF